MNKVSAVWKVEYDLTIMKDDRKVNIPRRGKTLIWSLTFNLMHVIILLIYGFQGGKEGKKEGREGRRGREEGRIENEEQK
jgi:hypothetical protein